MQLKHVFKWWSNPKFSKLSERIKKIPPKLNATGFMKRKMCRVELAKKVFLKDGGSFLDFSYSNT